jgi:hypothetical protein
VCSYHRRNARIDIRVPCVLCAIHLVGVSRGVRNIEVDLAVLARLVDAYVGADGGGELVAEVCFKLVSRWVGTLRQGIVQMGRIPLLVQLMSRLPWGQPDPP